MRAALPLLALVLLTPTATQAQAADAQQTAVAREAFEQGVAHFDAGRLEEAEEAFRRSLALRRSGAVLFNLASVLERRGDVVEPREYFIEVAADDAAPEELRGDARARAAALEPRVARLTVELDRPLGDATLRFGQRDIGQEMIGVAIPVDPGTEELVVERGGRVLSRQSVVLAEGGARTVELSLAAMDAIQGEPEGGGSQDEGGGGGGDDGVLVGVLVGAGAAVVLAIVGVVVGLEVERSRYFRGNVEPHRLVIEL